MYGGVCGVFATVGLVIVSDGHRTACFRYRERSVAES